MIYSPRVPVRVYGVSGTMIPCIIGASKFLLKLGSEQNLRIRRIAIPRSSHLYPNLYSHIYLAGISCLYITLGSSSS